MTFDAILFDMDGVLINSEEMWAKREGDFFRSLIPSFSNAECAQIIGGSIGATHALLQKKYNCTLSKNEFEEKYIRFGIENIYQKIQLTDGVLETLQMIRKKNIPLALGSSSPYAWIDIALDHLDVRKYFSVVVSADDVFGVGKPAPDIFEKAAALLSISPKKCLVLEDSTNGVLAGKAANMTVFGFTNNAKNFQDLSDADHHFAHFSELSNFF